MRWLWIDRFTEFQTRRYAVAVKNLSLAEDHFADHFPGYPVMPAPLMMEGLAQTGGILVGQANDFKDNVVLAKISKAKFTREAFPGEQLTYRTLIKRFREAYGDTLAGEFGPLKLKAFPHAPSPFSP